MHNTANQIQDSHIFSASARMLLNIINKIILNPATNIRHCRDLYYHDFLPKLYTALSVSEACFLTWQNLPENLTTIQKIVSRKVKNIYILWK